MSELSQAQISNLKLRMYYSQFEAIVTVHDLTDGLVHIVLPANLKRWSIRFLGVSGFADPIRVFPAGVVSPNGFFVDTGGLQILGKDDPALVSGVWEAQDENLASDTFTVIETTIIG